MSDLMIMNLANFKALLSIESNEGNDDLITSILRWNTDRILKAVGAGLKKARTEKYWGGRSFIQLKYTPIDIDAPISVVEMGAVSGIEVKRSSYDVEKEKGVIYLRPRVFADALYPNIHVTYTGGYIINEPENGDIIVTVPSQLEKAFILQCRYEYRNRDNLGLRGLETEDTTLTLAPAELLPEVTSIISNVLDNRLYVG